jgi:hypothetical protein
VLKNVNKSIGHFSCSNFKIYFLDPDLCIEVSFFKEMTNRVKMKANFFYAASCDELKGISIHAADPFVPKLQIFGDTVSQQNFNSQKVWHTCFHICSHRKNMWFWFFARRN